jgi:hypothetical protein
MNAIQEAEFHLSIYHYFLWKNAQEGANKSSNNNKYRLVVDVLLQQFPHHLAHFPPDDPRMLHEMPPLIHTLYVDYPALQREGTIDIVARVHG